MTFMRLAVAIVATACLASGQVIPVPQPVHMYPGTVTTPGGGLCTANFLYDGGNLAGGVFIPQQCAIDAGMGRPGPGGTFAAPPGTECRIINGSVPVWVFPCITVTVTDVRGQNCFCKVDVFVTKGQSYLNIALLSRAWGACVGACDDATTGAYWPTWPTAVVQVPAQPRGTFRTSGPLHEVFSVTLTGAASPTGTPTESAFAIVSSIAGHNFIPASKAVALGLTTVQTVDLGVLDPMSLVALDTNEFHTGRTVFDAVWLDGIDLGDGTSRSGHFLVIDDAACPVVVLAGRGNPVMQGVSYVPADPTQGGRDTLVFNAPAPAPGPAIQPFAVTPAVITPGMGVRIEPVLPAEGYVEGWTIVSFNCLAGPFGYGGILGLYPDAVTNLSFTRPPANGDLFHFTAMPGMYPEVPMDLPAGTLPVGSVADIAMAYVTPSGTVRVTGPARLAIF